MSLRLLSYNVRFGGAGREEKLAAVINACSPDVVILQEASRPDVVQRLAHSCEMKQWAAVRGNSLAFLSRIEIAHWAWHRAPMGGRKYLEIVAGAHATRIYGVHLAAVHSNVTEWRRGHEIRALLKGIASHQGAFHVVMGDFNTLAPGEELDLHRLPARLRAVAWMTGRRIRWHTIRLMLNSGYTDGYRVFHHGDPGYTFPTWDPHVRLDYAFIPAGFAGRLTACEIVQEGPSVRAASDHFPLLTEFSDEA